VKRKKRKEKNDELKKGDEREKMFLLKKIQTYSP